MFERYSVCELCVCRGGLSWVYGVLGGETLGCWMGYVGGWAKRGKRGKLSWCDGVCWFSITSSNSPIPISIILWSRNPNIANYTFFSIIFHTNPFLNWNILKMHLFLGCPFLYWNESKSLPTLNFSWLWSHKN